MSHLRGGQVRAARALLGMSQEQLAQLSSVGLNTVRRLEDAAEAGRTRTAKQIRTTLESAGVEFSPYGVHVKPPVVTARQGTERALLEMCSA